ncbi:MAG: hypothetical protein ACLQRH_21990 [Acidimicrobiales bacterium]
MSDPSDADGLMDVGESLDDDTLLVVPASYWADHPRKLTEAIRQALGLDADERHAVS